MTADLVAFLLACLDEDEATARREVAEGPSMHENGWELDPDVANGTRLCWVMSPAAVLADIEIKRAIVARCADDAAIADNPLRAQSAGAAEWHIIAMARDVLHLLASAYRGRAGWLEEWA